MIDCIFAISLKWIHAIFQIHEWKWFIFPKSEVLPAHLALFNSVCLRDVFWGFLGLIKFDIKLVVSYFFENLLLLLILKCLACYLGLPLITILAWDMLCLGHFEEVVLFWAPDASPLSVFSSVCLRTSNSLSMGKFDKWLKYIFF